MEFLTKSLAIKTKPVKPHFTRMGSSKKAFHPIRHKMAVTI
jgi:hypothetical protein